MPRNNSFNNTKKQRVFTVIHTIACGPILCKKNTVKLKVGEVEQADVSVVVVVVESTVKGALWDSACLSSGLNVTDDRDHWSFFFFTSVRTYSFSQFYSVLWRHRHHCYIVAWFVPTVMLVLDKWVHVVLFLTGVLIPHTSSNTPLFW